MEVQPDVPAPAVPHVEPWFRMDSPDGTGCLRVDELQLAAAVAAAFADHYCCTLQSAAVATAFRSCLNVVFEAVVYFPLTVAACRIQAYLLIAASFPDSLSALPLLSCCPSGLHDYLGTDISKAIITQQNQNVIDMDFVTLF